MYKVIVQFRDLTDGHLYNPGDTFPYDKRVIPADRIESLRSDKNRVSKPLIVEVKEIITEPVETPKKAVRTRKKKA